MKSFLYCVTGLYISLFINACVPENDPNYGYATAIVETCYHDETTPYGDPFGINLDPLRSSQLGRDWNSIFQDIEYLRDRHPFSLRITLRAHWMQTGADTDELGNLVVYWDKSLGSYYDQVAQIYNYAASTGFSVKIVGLLHGTPSFNSLDGWNGPGVPLDPAIWTDFVTTMLLDFPEIHDWEIWNEPDLDLSWKGTTAEFAELVYKPAFTVIRALRPGDTIIAPSWAQNMNYESFEPTIDALYPLFGWLGSVGEYYPDRGDLMDYFWQIGGPDAFDV